MHHREYAGSLKITRLFALKIGIQSLNPFVMG